MKFAGRFREIRSNPSSKILRFDRHQQHHDNNSTVYSYLENIHLNDERSSSLPIKSSIKMNLNSAELLNNSLPPQLNGHNKKMFLTSEKERKASYQSSDPSSLQKQKEKPAKKTKQHIPLRKPKVVSGFNVRKALQENPKDFHITAHNKHTDHQESNLKLIRNYSLPSKKNSSKMSHHNSYVNHM